MQTIERNYYSVRDQLLVNYEKWGLLKKMLFEDFFTKTMHDILDMKHFDIFSGFSEKFHFKMWLFSKSGFSF